MKPRLLIPLFAVAAGLAARAQGPDAPQPPAPPAHRGPDATHRPQPGPGNFDERREQFRKMAEQWRQRRASGAPQQPANPQEREAHIREALKHLHAAGLGFMAERIEQAVKQHAGAPQGAPQGPGQPSAGPSRGQHPSPGPIRPPFGGMSPQPFAQPGPIAPFGPPSQGRAHGGHHRGHHAAPQQGQDDLRAQVQTLARQVEELRNLVRGRLAEHGAAPRGEEHHRGPQAEPHRDGPQGNHPENREHHERKPEGNREHRDTPPQRPQGGPAAGGERRDPPPQRRPEGDRGEPKRDGVPAEEIKPALSPQSDSIE